MVTIGSNGSKIAYGIKHYNVDVDSDRLKIDTFRLTPGTTVFVIEDSKYFMLNGARKWIEIEPFGKGQSINNDNDQDGGDMDDSTPDDGGSGGSGDGSYDGGDLDA